MRLFLIRHGESVDNVAGVYAGSRDSSLTAHGALQARRLASSLAQSCALTHILSSPLRRAAKTAEAVCDAQGPRALDLGVTLVPELREKDFGSLEGVSFRHGKPASHDAESAQSMRERVDRFWHEHMLPLLHGEAAAKTDTACAVVAHGVLLRALASLLFDKVPPSDKTLASGFHGNASATDGSVPWLPSWSNTGYLEVHLSAVSSQAEAAPGSWHLRIERVNCTSHLDSLKKTRGGIGSAPFDESQRTMKHFFSPKPKPPTDAG
ncbi:hypothetical protein G6O67_000996 [Ophiocordyceps sinensis]|uniref:Phosphoglycerate mutase family protein n=2 Tax=Ophiocordyceps sinensis TaxID=72228 RepID=A0A8H4PWR4_9HYPO|nr:protein related to alpha-ribazole-5'-phosphate phosphatase [Ophiocordyceps sinensis CO18]KAF4511785.1 hypothetical protein G6O67_000996 [Ophiocordyceps sinensis]